MTSKIASPPSIISPDTPLSSTNPEEAGLLFDVIPDGYEWGKKIQEDQSIQRCLIGMLICPAKSYSLKMIVSRLKSKTVQDSKHLQEIWYLFLFSLIHEFIGFQTRRPLLLLNQVELRKSSEDWHLSEGRSHRLSKSPFLIIYVMLGFL